MAELSDLLNAMPDNSMIVLVSTDGGPPEVKQERIEQCLVLANNIDLFHIVFMANRPGVQKFQSYLEHEFFPPRTPLNDQMQYRILKWEGLLWVVISIPIEKRGCVYKAAEETRMRVANGVPTMIVGGGGEEVRTTMFPICTDRAYTLENEGDSPIYEGLGGAQDERAAESYWINKYLESKGILEVPEEKDADWWKDDLTQDG